MRESLQIHDVTCLSEDGLPSRRRPRATRTHGIGGAAVQQRGQSTEAEVERAGRPGSQGTGSGSPGQTRAVCGGATPATGGATAATWRAGGEATAATTRATGVATTAATTAGGETEETMEERRTLAADRWRCARAFAPAGWAGREAEGAVRIGMVSGRDRDRVGKGNRRRRASSDTVHMKRCADEGGLQDCQPRQAYTNSPWLTSIGRRLP